MRYANAERSPRGRERVETRREGRKARQSPDHEPETGGESRSGKHNPLVVGSNPTRPTTTLARRRSRLVPLSIKCPPGQVMLYCPMGHPLSCISSALRTSGSIFQAAASRPPRVAMPWMLVRPPSAAPNSNSTSLFADDHGERVEGARSGGTAQGEPPRLLFRMVALISNTCFLDTCFCYPQTDVINPIFTGLTQENSKVLMN
jgi:hypothetical protein